MFPKSLKRTKPQPDQDDPPEAPSDPEELMTYLRERIQPEDTGRLDGQRGVPEPTAETYGKVENEIVQAVQRARSAAVQDVQRDLSALDQRLKTENLDTRIEELGDTLSSVEARQATLGTTLGSEVRETHREYSERRDAITKFKERHGLERPAFVPDAGAKWLAFGFLAVLFLVETVLNGALLARIDTGGFIGGITMAAGISLANLVVPCFLFAPWLRQLAHRNWGRKALGVLGLATYLLAFLLFNLAVAHYREAPSSESISNLISDPFSLPEFASWLLFFLGFVFSVFALLDGLKMADPYPRYGKLQEVLEAKRNLFLETQKKVLESLEEERKELRNEVASKRRAVRYGPEEHNSLVTDRRNRISLFWDTLDRFEQVACTLLAEYRNANEATRSSAVPVHFKQEWRIDRDVSIEPSRFDYIDEEAGKRAVAHSLDRSESVEDALDKGFKQIREEISGLSIP